MARKKRIISIILTLCMALSGIPVYASEVSKAASDLLVHYDFSDISGNVSDGTEIADKSGNNHNATAKGNNLKADSGVLTLPGGSYGSGAGFVELPQGLFDGKDELTISIWMKNETGAGNYCGFYIGNNANSSNLPTQYFLLNPKNPSNVMKAVVTNSLSESAPYNTEVGVGATGNAGDGPATGNQWALYTVVLTEDSLTGYLNGVKHKSYSLNRNISDFGSNLLSYIGKSPYQDIFYKGGVRDLQIYTSALSDQDVASLYQQGSTDQELLDRAKEALTIPEISGSSISCTFVSAVTLVNSVTDGKEIKVSWESSNPAVIAEDGTVHDPGEETSVTLTATLSIGETKVTRTFQVRVIPAGDTTYSMVVDPENEGVEISQELIGLFFEDINSAADGGLFPEMVKNNSFENYFNVVSIEERGRGNMYSWKLHWETDNENGFTVEHDTDLSMNENNTNYAKLTGNITLKNGGFAPMNSPNSAAMPIEDGQLYDFSVWMLADSSYTGKLKVKVVNEKGQALTDEKTLSPVCDGTWQKVSAVLEGNKTQKGRILLTVEGAKDTDVLYMDMISLGSQDTYGYGNQNYAYGMGVRKDLVEKLMALNPSFMRFPGGCIIEGNSGRESYYNWEWSIGPLEERKAIGNHWASDNGSYTNTYGYMQSFGFGYHEILTLCEDMGAEPFPILSAGVFCQFANGDGAPAASGEELLKFAQHATHLIDYCWGSTLSEDPVQREWAQKRVDNGHENTFNLNYIGIGNENWGAKYLNNFEYIKDYTESYVEEHYPGRKMTIISSSGPAAEDNSYQTAWDWLNEKDAGETLVDEHYYQSKEFMLNNDDRYDFYNRLEDGGSNVFLGEYATHLGSRNNNLESAICDAAYLTGVERNGDIVRHASYAPLFEKIGSTNWTQNMIHFDEYDSFATPNYYVQQMFSNNYGEQIVNTTLEKKGENYTQNTGSPIIGTWATAGYATHIKVTREDGVVLLDDDLSSNGAGGMRWESVPGSTGSFTISDGKMTFSQGSGMNAVWLPDAVDNPEWHDYKVEATVVKTGGSEGFLVGAGAKDGENFYWYNMGGWQNTMTAVQRARTNRGTVVLGNNFKYGFTAIKTGESMDVVFNYGINGKLEAGYTSATVDKSNDFSGNLRPYQNDIYQVASKDDDYIYLKLVNHDSYDKDITLTYPCELASDQAEIITLAGDANAVNAIGNEKVVPAESTQTISGQELKYLVPAMSLSVIKVKYQEEVAPAEKVTVTYTAGEGGKIQGTAVQTIDKGSDASTVTAVANEGYTFVKWSDGSTNPSRTDINVTENKTFTAAFQKKAQVVVPDPKPVEKPVVKKGEKVSDNTFNYKVTSVGSKKTVQVTGLKKKSAKTITIPGTMKINEDSYKVTSIAAKAFAKNKKLTTVKMGSNITSIGKQAFDQCIKLKKLTIGKNAANIGDYAFRGCRELKKITIPSKVMIIGKGAFQNCKKLQLVDVKSKKVKSVKKAAFKGVSKKITYKFPGNKKQTYSRMFK